MKPNFKGIRFSTWLYFTLFSLGVLLVIGILQLVLIKPYYRNDRINNIETLARSITNNIISNEYVSEDNINNTLEAIINSNVCVMVLDNYGNVVYDKDALGASCAFNSSFSIEDKTYNTNLYPKELISLLNEEDEIAPTFLNPELDLDMLLYGKKINTNLGTYYLYINSPLEPVESVIAFIFNQYLFIGIVVLFFAIILSIWFSNRISRPIIKITKEANKLAEGNYDTNFNVKSYSEIDDLAFTLDDASEKLSKVDELRKDLIANMSHDIKTPLTMIKAYSEMIKDISGNDEIKRNEHLDVIIKEAEYLDNLVSDMRELSKMQAGYIELKRQNFEIAEAIEEVIELHEAIISEKHIKLMSDIKKSIIWGDEIKLKQVISNFLSNAIKYTKDNSTITIKTYSNDEKYRFEISDEGQGIEEKDLPYIWDRYYKIDKSFSRNIQSTGLGLAISRSILEAHGAKYGVSSILNEGTTFYFELSKDYEKEE